MAKTRLRIKELLQERNMTQAELADKLGISRMTLNQNISRNNWTLGKLEEIAAAIGCRVVDLFDNTYTITCPDCGKEINIVFNIKGFEGLYQKLAPRDVRYETRSTRGYPPRKAK